ncbi:unnamed protein product, partial [Meganyctiphanes norvegica]
MKTLQKCVLMGYTNVFGQFCMKKMTFCPISAQFPPSPHSTPNCFIQITHIKIANAVTNNVEDLHNVADGYITETWEYNPNNDWPFKSTFMMKESVAADTGLYSCYYQDNVVMQDSTFVYVYDGIQGVVGSVVVKAIIGEPLIIGCVPTLPNITLTLQRNTQDVTQNFSWNRMVGFVKQKTTAQDAGLYQCQALGFEQTHSVYVAAKVTKPPPPPPYNARKYKLYLNFSIMVAKKKSQI